MLPSCGIPIGTTGNITLSAIWSQNPITYIISYILNGGDNNPNNPTDYTALSIFSMNISGSFLTGYEFLYWMVKYTNGTLSMLPSSGIPAGTTGNIMLIAMWNPTPIQYNITYVLNGGINVSGNPTKYHVACNFPMNIYTPYRAGYVFQNWWAIYANGTEAVLPTSGIPKGTTGNIML